VSNPLLSVCLITYNQAKYIREAIDSVLMQKVNFTWELIIADDCSTDGTREIVLEYRNRYPDFIKLILQETNVGAAQNWMDLMAAPSSKYIAYFEADDYWTDPLKLQKQVDFLEAHPEFIICFHNMNIIDEEIGDTRVSNINQKEVTTIEDIIKKDWHIMTASMIFRNHVIKFPDWFATVKTGDYALQLLLACHGKAYYIDEVMGVFRKHSQGASSNIFPGNALQFELIKLLLNLNKYSMNKYNKVISFRVSELQSFVRQQGMSQKLCDLAGSPRLTAFWKFLWLNLCDDYSVITTRFYWGTLKRILLNGL
jgi:glycosyltransferase involved in cell wall biosynthesis